MLLHWYKIRGLRKQANHLLEMSSKVDSLRQDILPADDLAEQRKHHATLKALLKAKPFNEDAVTAAAQSLHETMLRTGGKVYPVSFGTDWTEMFILAAIVAGGIRAFFITPMKIPTNSMWPTYHGMTAEVRSPNDPTPSITERVWGKLTQWSTTIAPITDASGEVCIPIQRTLTGYEPTAGNAVPDNGILGTRILRGIDRVYTLYVANSQQYVQVPDEFAIRSVYLKTFFKEEAKLPLSEAARWERAMQNAEVRGKIVTVQGQTCVRTETTVKAGGHLLNFDILTGDMLFVDKVRYNFVKPSGGQTFVFSTRNIPELNRNGEQYFIKRLVGEPGDTLQVLGGKLLRKGSPTPVGSPIELNNQPATDLNYFGYLPRITPSDAMPLDRPHTVSERAYFSMGDNSSNSYDSRGWGEVPEKDVVGPPLFILYPFTARWGAAR